MSASIHEKTNGIDLDRLYRLHHCIDPFGIADLRNTTMPEACTFLGTGAWLAA
jgi:hypothetical protein